MDDFVLIVPSNVQPDLHTDNTASRFRVTFDHDYDFKGEAWEVALMEITFVNSMYNIVNESYRVIRESPEDVIINVKLGNKHGEFKFPNTVCPIHLTYLPNENVYALLRAGGPEDVTYTMAFDTALEMGFISPDSPRLKGQILAHPILENGQNYVVAKYPPASSITSGDLNIYRSSGKVKPRQKDEETHYYPLKKGYYSTLGEITQELNKGYTRLEDKVQQQMDKRLRNINPAEKKASDYHVEWGYDDHLQRIGVAVDRGYVLIMENDLHEILGFKSRMLPSGSYAAYHPPLLNRGVYNFFIYCSICADIQVGHVRTPLLRTVDVGGGKKWGTVVNRAIATPIYIPLNATSFNSILFEIRDDTGQLIEFSSGKTTLTLHFRPRRQRL